jgi:hypothetical protein
VVVVVAAAVAVAVAAAPLQGSSRVCRKLPRRLLRQREVRMRLYGHLDCIATRLPLRLQR